MQHEQDERLKLIKKLSESEQKARAVIDDPLSYL
jgi:hypothetical protein